MPIDKPTDELRVVLSDACVPGRPVIAVQRKFLVQNGKPYSPADFGPPESKDDVFINVIDGRPMWQPMKEEWRDLPAIGEGEAYKKENDGL